MPTDSPLRGKRILVTRARGDASKLAALLRSHGAHPVKLPAIDVLPVEDPAPLRRARAGVGNYDWIVFTSVNGVRAFFEEGVGPRMSGGPRIAAIGPKTASALEEHGWPADFLAVPHVAEAIADGIEDWKWKRVLLARADIARKDLAEILRARGALVDDVAVYRTVSVAVEGGRLRSVLLARRLDWITFTSSSTVRGLVAAAREADCLEALHVVRIACIGPITASTCREEGLSPDVVARIHTIEGMVAAMLEAAQAREAC